MNHLHKEKWLLAEQWWSPEDRARLAVLPAGTAEGAFGPSAQAPGTVEAILKDLDEYYEKFKWETDGA